MRWVLKIIFFPIILLLSILVSFLKFTINISAIILGIISFLIGHHNGKCSRHSIKEDYVLGAAIHALNDYLSKYNDLLNKVSKIDITEFTFDVDFKHLNSEKRKYERLRQSLYTDLEAWIYRFFSKRILDLREYRET